MKCSTLWKSISYCFKEIFLLFTFLTSDLDALFKRNTYIIINKLIFDIKKMWFLSHHIYAIQTYFTLMIEKLIDF